MVRETTTTNEILFLMLLFNKKYYIDKILQIYYNKLK
jgi:hypothetical protein